jgi:hypothetical protein
MINEAELKVEIFRIIDSQKGESLQEVYDWLSDKMKERELVLLIEQGYKDMAEDKEREQEASEWIEGTLNSSDL